MKENLDIERRGHLQLARRVKQLEEENKKLKEKVSELEDVSKDYDLLSKDFITLGEENKNLRAYADNLDSENDNQAIEIEELKKENKKLEEENKNLKEAMKELNNYNKFRIQENERLKSDLGECECSFGFENDEVGFWKGEYKRLKKWIKDHCKGYGNLFPEDEMKRQWKKADKKRKNIFMEEDTLQELKDIGEI